MPIQPVPRIRILAHERGATAVEYALMVALITLAIIGAVTVLGLAVPGLFEPASETLSSHGATSLELI